MALFIELNGERLEVSEEEVVRVMSRSCSM
jgi:prophage maintenance system killer protein